MPLLARMLATPLAVDVRPGAIAGLAAMLAEGKISAPDLEIFRCTDSTAEVIEWIVAAHQAEAETPDPREMVETHRREPQ